MTVSNAPAAVVDQEQESGDGRVRVMLGRFLRHRLGMAGLIVLALVALAAVVVPLFWPYTYGQITSDLSQRPSAAHPMGTDNLGRDQLAQVLRGVQQSLLIAFTVTVIATMIGVVVGTVSGYFGGAVDATAMRLVDLTLTLPTIAIAAFLGSVIPAGGVSWAALALVLGSLMWTPMARLVRGVILSLRELGYVDAARVMGAGHLRIMFRHLVPNAADHIIIAATLMFGAAILAESGLSFLGFGVQPPDTSLGLLVANSQSAVLTRPWLFYFPGLLIVVIVLAANYVGEGLRDAFNPRATPFNPLSPSKGVSAPAPTPVMKEPDAGTLLQISGLRVSFGDSLAVDGVDLSLAPGEVLALVGESGSGKTLTAMSVVGMLPPTARASGQITFQGSSLNGLSYNQWRAYRGRRIAVIPQDPSTTLNPVLTIAAQFADSMSLTDAGSTTARQRMNELLASMAIRDPERLLGQYPHQLSGGMRQRIAIALSMVHEPDLIIADEPTTALDVTVQAQVMSTLRIAREKVGAGMLFITHDLSLVAGLADRVAVMQAGAIVEEGDVYTIFSSPSDPYTQNLLSLAPRIPYVEKAYSD